MNTMLLKIRTPALLLAAFSSTAAGACIAHAPFEMEDIRQADVIFTGELTHFERVSPGRPESLDDYGLLTFRVTKTIKGNIPEEVQLYWWNSTFGVPEKMETGYSLLVAAVNAKTSPLPLRGASATVFPTRRPDLLQVMQAPCSSPFLLEDSGLNIAEAQKILRGQPASVQSPVSWRKVARSKVQADEVHGARLERIVIGAGLMAIAIAGGLALYSRRKGEGK